MFKELMRVIASINAVGNTIVFGISLMVPGHWGFVAVSLLAMVLSGHLALLAHGEIKSP